MVKLFSLLSGALVLGRLCNAQNIMGRVADAAGKPIVGAQVVCLPQATSLALTDSTGRFTMTVPLGEQKLVAVALGYKAQQISKTVQMGKVQVDFSLEPLETSLEAVTIESERLRGFGMNRLAQVQDFGLYEAKKSEVIALKDITANQATNNSRQIYARVPGLNIWESDQAGLQLGIGGRGLSPNRTNNFNTRQNGYDISADALGYPESYYTPPPEATEQIEIVRGAGALQYGTQFGGMLNFKLLGPDTTRRLGLDVRQSVGSWGFANSHVGARGQVGRVGYAAFYQHKRADGWRPNSAFSYHMARGLVTYKASTRLRLGVEYTFMHYLARQPGGLTDRQYAADPRQSLRTRNWFAVDWHLMAAFAEYRLSDRTQANLRLFGLVARRQALGNLDPVIRIDFPNTPRNLIDGQFRNVGAEARVVHQGRLLGRATTLLTGVRLYRGFATTQQGRADSGTGPAFRFAGPPSQSDYRFPSFNAAWFAEAVWALNERWSLVPGLRAERIVTESQGRYTVEQRNGAGTLLARQDRTEALGRRRNLLLAGLGIGYKPLHGRWEGYANFCQNYRAINFNDIRIDNPSLRIDSNIRDERGFSADVGLRSRGRGQWLQYDISAFWLQYNARIGTIVRNNEPPLFVEYRYRSNIGDATIRGLEGYAEADLLRAWRAMRGQDAKPRKVGLAAFATASYVDARYTRSLQPRPLDTLGVYQDPIKGKTVELVPAIIIRGGLTLGNQHWRLALQTSYVGEQFTDASNQRFSPTGIVGVLPAYTVLDLSAQYRITRHWRLEASCNNLTDARYVTRRADGYPGPGIIPADARAYYGTVVFTW